MSNILLVMVEKSVAQDLWVALQQGFVLPGTQNYRFPLARNMCKDNAQDQGQNGSFIPSYR